jgi:hypothetical protein
VQLSLPLALEVRFVILAESPHSAVPPLSREIEIEPASDLVPEGFLLGGKTQIHDLEAIKPGRSMRRNQDGSFSSAGRLRRRACSSSRDGIVEISLLATPFGIQAGLGRPK